MKIIGGAALLMAGILPAFGGAITSFTVTPEGAAQPGTDYVWDASVTNNTGDYMVVTGEQSNFPIAWTFTDNIDGSTPGTLADGATGTFSIDVAIPNDTVPGTVIGDYTFTLSYDLYGDPEATSDYIESDTIDSNASEIDVAAQEAPAVPEPTTKSELLLAMMVLPMSAAWMKKRSLTKSAVKSAPADHAH